MQDTYVNSVMSNREFQTETNFAQTQYIPVSIYSPKAGKPLGTHGRRRLVSSKKRIKRSSTSGKRSSTNYETIDQEAERNIPAFIYERRKSAHGDQGTIPVQWVF